MKRTILLLGAIVFIMIAVVFGCAKSNPTQSTNTPVVTATATASVNSTSTETITPMATATVTATVTSIPTIDSTALVSVPGGQFMQTDGSSVFSNTIDPFRIGKYEVTYDLWYTVYQWALSNGYVFANAGREGNDGVIGAAPTGARFEPVTEINWRDAIVWCNALSENTGLEFVYYIDSGFVTPLRSSYNASYAGSQNPAPGSFDNPYVKWSAAGYRLPTEAEWSYAATYIDGTNWTPFDYASGAAAAYSDAAATQAVAWYDANSGSGTHNAGGKIPNTLGIYDMSGNSWEWCWDWSVTYPAGPTTNYRGPASGTYRAGRGGNFDSTAATVRSAVRYSSEPYYELYYFLGGLRFARTN